MSAFVQLVKADDANLVKPSFYLAFGRISGQTKSRIMVLFLITGRCHAEGPSRYRGEFRGDSHHRPDRMRRP